MKKNPNSRVRRNGSAKAAAQQAPNRQVNPAHAGDVVTVVFQAWDGSEFARVDFQAELFEKIESVRHRLGITLAELFKRAIIQKARAQGGLGL